MVSKMLRLCVKTFHPREGMCRLLPLTITFTTKHTTRVLTIPTSRPPKRPTDKRNKVANVPARRVDGLFHGTVFGGHV